MYLKAEGFSSHQVKKQNVAVIAKDASFFKFKIYCE